jgi:hypothetical protein
MNVAALGAVTAEFSVNDGIIQGHVAGNNPEGLMKLAAEADNLSAIFNDMLINRPDKSIYEIDTINFIVGDVHRAVSGPESETQITTEDQNERMDAVKVSSKELYLVAKAFITFIQRWGTTD